MPGIFVLSLRTCCGNSRVDSVTSIREICKISNLIFFYAILFGYSIIIYYLCVVKIQALCFDFWCVVYYYAYYIALYGSMLDSVWDLYGCGVDIIVVKKK